VIFKRLRTTAQGITNNNVTVPFSVSGSGLQLNQTLNGTEGFLSSPNFPGNYYHNLDYWMQLIGPERTRLVVQFQHLDLELQNECLYDFVELTSIGREGQLLSDAVRWCGNHQSETDRSVDETDPCSSSPWTFLTLQNGKI
jgi:hypothetical protein